MQVAQNTEKELRYDTQTSIQKNAEKHILNVPRGGEYKLVLSDGTRVHANAESRLTYPVSFTGNKREVYLTGEALFEVAKDTLHPFIVHTPYGIVEVVGTRFNVNTYEKNQTTVTLEEGAVKVYCEEKKGTEQKSLSPGEQAVIQSKQLIHKQFRYRNILPGQTVYTNIPIRHWKLLCNNFRAGITST